MAADWIKVEHGLPSKPEVMELADTLGVSDNEAVGLLIRFWLWVDVNLSPFCPVVPGTMSRIDRVVGVDGFATAMQSVGWLNINDGEVAIPNYSHHLSQSAKRRGVESRKKRLQRQNVSRSCPDDKGTKQGTREEKRREEKIPPKSPKGDDGAFDAFWQSVHLRTGKDAARRAFANAAKRLRREGRDNAEGYITERMAAFAKTPQAHPTDRTPIHPATWLNQGRYDDDPAAWQGNGHNDTDDTPPPVVRASRPKPEGYEA